MDTRRMIETFNTHLMDDEVVRALATGREDELAQIMPAIRRAAAEPHIAPTALMVYGERGSGKSFLLRLVQLESANIEGAACILLPEEQYNVRAPHQLLQVVAAQVRGEDWSDLGWRIDPRTDEQAWEEELAALHTALDALFGAGRGMAVVLLENFDSIVTKLFGATPAPKTANRGPAVAKRQAEERLRKLMGARGGRFMLIASATGTVDMDYERPLFQAFTLVDLQGWSADTAISYYNKVRELQGQPALSVAEEARARAITEFIGGNARLAQLLGVALSSPSARSIADTLDQLVDHLADYYRQRMDALPPAAAAVLDEMIRGGEPVSQTGLGERVKGNQRHIADAFSFLTRGRLVQAARERGGAAQLYRVRDRLFVHFYRRRYGKVSGLAAIAELLERFYTPEERAQYIRFHLELGEYEDARAFGLTPLSVEPRGHDYCLFQNEGITDGPPHYCFALAGLAEDEIARRRRQMVEYSDQAAHDWLEAGKSALNPLQEAAMRVLAGIALSRSGHDAIARQVLGEAVEIALAKDNPDALIVACDAMTDFLWSRENNVTAIVAKLAEMSELAKRASCAETKAIAYFYAALSHWGAGRYTEAEVFDRLGLDQAFSPDLRLRLLYGLVQALLKQDRHTETLEAALTLLSEARRHASRIMQQQTLILCCVILIQLERPVEALESAQEAVGLASEMGMVEEYIDALFKVALSQRALQHFDEALITARRCLLKALGSQPPLWREAVRGSLLAVTLLFEKKSKSAFEEAAQMARQALGYTEKAGNTELALQAVEALILAASEVPQPDALDILAQAFERDPGLANRGSDWIVAQRWFAAAIRAGTWDTALALAQRYPNLVQGAMDVWNIMLELLGEKWSQTAIQEGRAAAYAHAAKAVPAIKALFALRPLQQESDQEQVATPDLMGLVSPLVADCKDPGFLRDVADLLETHFNEAASTDAAFLRLFAELHDAPDKEAYLQRIDPDQASMMRRILNLPEPKDTLTKRGRRRAR